MKIGFEVPPQETPAERVAFWVYLLLLLPALLWSGAVLVLVWTVQWLASAFRLVPRPTATFDRSAGAVDTEEPEGGGHA